MTDILGELPPVHPNFTPGPETFQDNNSLRHLSEPNLRDLVIGRPRHTEWITDLPRIIRAHAKWVRNIELQLRLPGRRKRGNTVGQQRFSRSSPHPIEIMNRRLPPAVISGLAGRTLRCPRITILIRGLKVLG
jgi:hypothetical protein